MKIESNGGGRPPDFRLKVGLRGRRFHKPIGAAWKLKSGGIAIKLDPGLALVGGTDVVDHTLAATSKASTKPLTKHGRAMTKSEQRLGRDLRPLDHDEQRADALQPLTDAVKVLERRVDSFVAATEKRLAVAAEKRRAEGRRGRPTTAHSLRWRRRAHLLVQRIPSERVLQAATRYYFWKGIE